MFEVGKKYKNINFPNELYECVAIHGEKGWLLFNGKPLTYDWSGNWKEYKEPRTITRWVNVYDKGGELVMGDTYSTKEEAIRFSSGHTLDIIPITYTEPL